MFSLRQNRFVLIDYNLSDVLEVQPGCKAWLSYRGTLQYSYSDLVEMYKEKKEKAYIDPYFCDAYALEKSITQLS